MLTQNLNTHWLTPNAKLAQFLQSQLTMDLSMGMSQLRLVFMTPGDMDFHRVPQSKIKILLISVLFVIVFS